MLKPKNKLIPLVRDMIRRTRSGDMKWREEKEQKHSGWTTFSWTDGDSEPLTRVKVRRLYNIKCYGNSRYFLVVGDIQLGEQNTGVGKLFGEVLRVHQEELEAQAAKTLQYLLRVEKTCEVYGL